MTIPGETVINNGEVLHEERFICTLISRFISLVFLSTSVALNILSLYQLFCDSEYFLHVPIWALPIWASTCFLEVTCLDTALHYLTLVGDN